MRDLDVPVKCERLHDKTMRGKSRDAAIWLFCLTRCA